MNSNGIFGEDVPFVPGESPFRCKGLLYTELIAYCGEFVPGGWDRAFGMIGDPRLRGFLKTRFVVGGWYDVFPLITANRAVAMALGQPYLEWLRKFARWQLERQLNGVYRFFLKVGSPEWVVQRLPGLVSKYYEFLQSEVEQVAPRIYLSRVSGVPAIAEAGYKVSTESGIVLVLELAGAKNVRHRWLSSEPDGEKHKLKIVKLVREIRWD